MIDDVNENMIKHQFQFVITIRIITYYISFSYYNNNLIQSE